MIALEYTTLAQNTKIRSLSHLVCMFVFYYRLLTTYYFTTYDLNRSLSHLLCMFVFYYLPRTTYYFTTSDSNRSLSHLLCMFVSKEAFSELCDVYAVKLMEDLLKNHQRFSCNKFHGGNSEKSAL